jgi:hypothetical protein
MATSKSRNTNGTSVRGSRGAGTKRPVGRGKHIRVEATRRERIDPDMIALCYWLIAQRIVQAADDEADGEETTAAPPTGDATSADTGNRGNRSPS